VFDLHLFATAGNVTTANEIESLSIMLAKSTLLPVDLRGKEADIAVTVMTGRELGLGPMAALRLIHVVKGRPILSADAMVALVLSSGLAEYFLSVESTDRVATYETQRKGSPIPQRLSYTIEQAHKAGLTGENWKKYPEAMLRARAKAALSRDCYPDVLAGCYDPDEVLDFRDPPTVVAATEFRAPELLLAPSADAQEDFISSFRAATSITELSEVAARAKGVTGVERTRLLDAYRARLDSLTEVA